MDTKEEFVGMLKENQNKPVTVQEGNKLPQYVCAIISKYCWNILPIPITNYVNLQDNLNELINRNRAQTTQKSDPNIFGE